MPITNPTTANPAQVYHFTDTVRLPWILASGELRPSRSTVPPYLKHDFLWATSNRNGSQTATLMNAPKAYKSGTINIVRFTLPASLFEFYLTAISRYPEWSSDHVRTLEQTAREKGEDPDAWHVADAPIPSTSWVAIEMRSYANPAWIPIDPPVLKRGDELGVIINDRPFFSTRFALPGSGRIAYGLRTQA
jgi:hypothetical protein